MAKKVQLMTNAKEWQTVNGVEVLVDVPQEDLDPITDSNCVEIEGHRTLEETISQENMFTPEIVETKVHSKVGGVYHDNVVDGAYEEAILYGNTQVNLVESMTSGTKYIPHSFTSFQGNESKIGNYNSGRTNQVAPLVKGVTMVNLAQKTSVTIPEGHNGGPIENVKSNTKYTLALDFTVQNTQKGFSIHAFKDNTYLETSMIRTGMGEKVKFTFTTHEEANTIYIVNNNGYGGEIQLDNIMVIEGDVTDLDLPFFKGMRSVELSRPLTNLFTDDLVHYNANTSSTNINGNITVTSTSVSSWNGTDYYLKNLKPHTKYIVMWDSLTTTQTSTTQQDILICAVCIVGNSRLGGINEDAKCPTLRSIIFDTRDKPLNEIAIRIHASMSNSEATSTTVTGLRVFEWDDSLRTLDLQTIGYFSGTKYVSARTLETEGKNLYPYGDINFTPTSTGWFDAKGNGNMYGDVAQKSKCRFLLKKGTYYLSMGEGTNISSVQLINDKEEMLPYTPLVLEQDAYLTIRVNTSQSNVATTLTNIQIERGETATTYEAYHSRYYKPRETEKIILRSLPNGVCDTFNLQTGEYVQRIGEIVLDGSEDWTLSTKFSSTYNSYYFELNEAFRNNIKYANDKYQLLSDEEDLGKKIGIYMGSSQGKNAPFISSDKMTLSEFKEYLQQNPVTVQYELKEPIITKLQTYDRIYNGQTNALVSMGNNLSALSYIASNHYLKVGNLSPVHAILEPITSIPYDVRLKPSTLYTVKYNRGGNSNSMKFNLGGSVVEKTNSTDLGIVPEEFTVKTPAILSHEQLILSGTGYAHNFIIVEGDITGTELPYFEGMKDVKMPIVKNAGKNLFDGELEMGSIYLNNGVNYDSIYTIRTKNFIPIKSSTQYILKNDKNYAQNIIFYDEQQRAISYCSETIVFITPINAKYLRFRCAEHLEQKDLNTKFQLEEGSVTTPYEPYKENSVYAVQGEIPFSEDMFEQGTTAQYSANIGKTYQWMKENSTSSWNVRRLRTKSLIKIEPNTKLILQNTDNFMYAMGGYGVDKLSLGTFDTGWVQNTTITIPQDVHYISFAIRKKDDTNITINDFNQTNFALLKPDETIALRSLPNGVKDELNLLTGEYIQRVGEVVLDGSEEQEWSIGINSNVNLLDFYIHNIIPNGLNNGDGISDKFNYVNGVWHTQVAGICVNMDKGISMMLPTKYVKTQDLQGCLEWLQQNPITVQYELAEPIISYPRIVSNTQEREVGVKLPNGVCDTYNPSTGITVKRVGKVVLDGSEGWKLATTKTNTQVFESVMIGIDTKTVNNLVCDKIPVSNGDGSDTEKIATAKDVSSIYIALLKTKASTVDELKTYLASNPITVWYELKYPIVTTDIVLPNGVHDEYNPLTGLYTKRVGYIELDGGKRSLNYRVHTNGYLLVDIDNIKLTGLELEPTNNILSNVSVFTVNRIFHNIDITTTCVALHHQAQSLMVRVVDSSITPTNVDEYTQYLSQNPIKLWYELSTPITYQLTPYFGLPMPYAYKDGYLIMDSAYAETTLPPEFKYKLVANRTGQIVQNGRKLQEHTTRLSNLEALIIEATIESLFNRELQLFELELMDIQLIDLGE